nr:MAG TPA: hypothetical protein [Caudoviricetes sp.]
MGCLQRNFPASLNDCSSAKAWRFRMRNSAISATACAVGFVSSCSSSCFIFRHVLMRSL